MTKDEIQKIIDCTDVLITNSQALLADPDTVTDEDMDEAEELTLIAERLVNLERRLINKYLVEEENDNAEQK